MGEQEIIIIINVIAVILKCLGAGAVMLQSGIAAEEFLVQFDAVPHLPTRFFPAEKDPEWVQGVGFGFDVPDNLNVHGDDIKTLSRHFFRDTRNEAWLVGGAGSKSGALNLITWGDPTKPYDRMPAINRTILRRPSEATISGLKFNVIDLSGCAVNSAMVEFLGALEFNGLLVCPFAGVRSEHLRALPAQLSGLVVYNCHLSREFFSEVMGMEGLRSIVLWGCSSAEQMPDDWLGSIEDLTVLACSRDFTSQIAKGDLSNLESLRTDYLDSFAYAGFGADGKRLPSTRSLAQIDSFIPIETNPHIAEKLLRKHRSWASRLFFTLLHDDQAPKQLRLVQFGEPITHGTEK